MLGDPWPEEPDEPDGTRFDGEGAATAPPELRRAFWGLVAVLNVALLALVLGPMLIAFRGQWLVGGAILGIGIVALAYALHRYRKYRRSGVAGP